MPDLKVGMRLPTESTERDKGMWSPTTSVLNIEKRMEQRGREDIARG